MLALTASATEAIHGLLTAQELPDSAGFRIAGEPQVTEGGAAELDLTVMIAEEPHETDQVLDEGGARVFVDELVAPVLDDKLLDANVASEGVSFTLTQQAA
jgi:Fe-S cluster assembly iron-binding protein IscA